MSETTAKLRPTDEELLQKLKDRREKANLAVKKKEEKIKEKIRRNRERNIIEKGNMIEDFGLLDCDLHIWVGMLDEITVIFSENPDKVIQWKKNGEHILSLTPIERKERQLNREKITGGQKIECQRV